MKDITVGIRLLAAVFFVITFFSCANKIPQQSNPTIVYPTPPDKARIQYLASISTSENVVKPKSSFNKFLVGEDPPKPIKKPYGITMHGNKIYLCDLDIAGLEIMDMDQKTFEYFVPKGLGQLKLPINSFVDSLGYLYVADSKRKQVVIYDNNLEYVNSLGGATEDKPTDVFVTSDKIWVANVAKGAIDVYQKDSTYKHLYSIDGGISQDEKIRQPTNIYVTDNRLYVSDFGAFNIKIYDHKGKYIQKIGRYGRSIGQFVRPKGIAVDKEGILYVVDAAFENVQMFDKEGRLLMFFGGSYEGPGDMWLPAKVSISYTGLEYFEQYVDSHYELQYLILVTNNFGPDKLSIYGYIKETP
ncbi:MAG: 6-bladed beta-propeller [Bacteroidota bacterium]